MPAAAALLLSVIWLLETEPVESLIWMAAMVEAEAPVMTFVETMRPEETPLTERGTALVTLLKRLPVIELLPAAGQVDRRIAGERIARGWSCRRRFRWAK